jgi:RHS repeat-associated protein
MVEAYTDGMGSVGALVPENGTAANAGHYRYDAYGNFRTSAHPGDCKDDPSGLTCNAPLTYTGHLYDAESNLFYFGARYYDPETGRFLTNDPVAGDALNPPSLHKYLYAYDSPMVYTDPWGEAVGDWWDVRSYADAEAWKNIGHDLWNVASLGTLERVEKQNNLGTWAGAGESVFQGARSISNTASLGLQESIYETQMEEGPGLSSLGMGISKAAYNLTPMEEVRQLVQEGDQMSTGEKVSAVFMGISKTAGLIAGAKAGAEWGAGRINSIANKPVMQGEGGIKPVEGMAEPESVARGASKAPANAPRTEPATAARIRENVEASAAGRTPEAIEGFKNYAEAEGKIISEEVQRPPATENAAPRIADAPENQSIDLSKVAGPDAFGGSDRPQVPSRPETASRIEGVAKTSFDYAAENPRVAGLNRMQLGKDAEIQATRWLRRWAEANNIPLSEEGLRFQVRGAHSVPDVIFEPDKLIMDFKLTPKAVRSVQARNFANDFPEYEVKYIFGPGGAK